MMDCRRIRSTLGGRGSHGDNETLAHDYKMHKNIGTVWRLRPRQGKNTCWANEPPSVGRFEASVMCSASGPPAALGGQGPQLSIISPAKAGGKGER